MMQKWCAKCCTRNVKRERIVLITCFIKIDMTKLHKVTHTRKVPDTCLKSRREDDTNLVKSIRTKPRAPRYCSPVRDFSSDCPRILQESESTDSVSCSSGVGSSDLKPNLQLQHPRTRCRRRCRYYPDSSNYHPT
jgi:hypothetical protein